MPRQVPPKTLPDGTPNPLYVDRLTEDRVIPNQQYGCFSFILPTDILKQKEHFFFESFVNQWEFSQVTHKCEGFMQFISKKYSLPYDELSKDFTEFIMDTKDEFTHGSEVPNQYKTFVELNEDVLTSKFGADNDFQTSVLAVKNSGNWPTEAEAKMRAKMQRDMDPTHHVYVGPVGKWLPINPDPNKTCSVEYAEEELNELIHEKEKNEETAKQVYDARIRDTKLEQIRRNAESAAHTAKLAAAAAVVDVSPPPIPTQSDVVQTEQAVIPPQESAYVSTVGEKLHAE